MQLLVSTDSDKCLIQVSGKIDTMTAGHFEKEVISALPEVSPKLVISLKEVNYISSAGLRAFLVIGKCCKSKSLPFYLSELDNNLLQLFKMTGFDKLFNFIG